MIGDFKSRPTSFFGREAGGTARFPGFHTSDDFEKTLPYAQMKLEDVPDDPGDDPIPGLQDFPVVVELDMSGLASLADADAVQIRNDLVDAFLEAGRHLEAEGGDSWEVFCDYVDSIDMGSERETVTEVGSDAVTALFEMTGPTTDSFFYSIRNYMETLDGGSRREILEGLKKALVRDDVVKEAIGQYRYMDDVPETRILKVTYVAPYFDHVFDFPDGFEEDDEAEVEAVEGAGYAIITMEDVANMNVPVTRVEEVEIREPDDGARVEYHGTTYRNLLEAAPGIADKLPTPPVPFQG